MASIFTSDPALSLTIAAFNLLAGTAGGLPMRKIDDRKGSAFVGMVESYLNRTNPGRAERMRKEG